MVPTRLICCSLFPSHSPLAVVPLLSLLSTPSWIFAPGPLQESVHSLSAPCSIAYAAETGPDVVCSAPQCGDAPHSQKKLRPAISLSCSRIMGIRPWHYYKFFLHHLWERSSLIQVIYLTITVDLPPFGNSLGQDLSMLMFATSYHKLYHLQCAMKIAHQILTMWAIKHSWLVITSFHYSYSLCE